MKEKQCSLCGNEVVLRYSLSKYGMKDFVCGYCYNKKLKEIYDIKN